MGNFFQRLFGKRKPDLSGKEKPEIPVKNLFQDNSYLIHQEKRDILVGVALRKNILSFDDKLVESNAEVLKQLATNYNVKIVAFTSDYYPIDPDKLKKLHQNFIAAGVSEAYFTSAPQQIPGTENFAHPHTHVVVTAGGLVNQELQMTRTGDKLDMYLHACERENISKDNVIACDDSSQSIQLYMQFEENVCYDVKSTVEHAKKKATLYNAP